MLEDIDKPAQVMVVAEKIRKAIARHFEPLGRAQKVTASIGASIYPTHGKSTANLISAADNAMYKAKAKGNSCVLFKLAKSVS